MTESRRITELNHRSVELTDAELSIAQKFSVLLPMNDLPEIVVTGDSGASSPLMKPKEESVDEVATIPFQSETATAKSPSASTDQTAFEGSSNRTAVEKKNDDDLLASVELPQDELSISKDAEDSSASATDGVASQETEEDEADENQVSDFRIEDFGQHTQQVEGVAKSIESVTLEERPHVVSLTNASGLYGQDVIFNSLLVSMAKRNPTLRLVAIQLSEPEVDLQAVSMGVGNVLSEEYLLEDVVIPTSVENLDYLAYSESSLSRNTFRNRFHLIHEDLKKHYDLVLVNCGWSGSTYGGVASELADSVYLLVSLQVCETESMEIAANDLRKSGARLAGCIVTEYQRDAS